MLGLEETDKMPGEVFLYLELEGGQRHLDINRLVIHFTAKYNLTRNNKLKLSDKCAVNTYNKRATYNATLL